jgi:hypothetical protein
MAMLSFNKFHYWKTNWKICARSRVIDRPNGVATRYRSLSLFSLEVFPHDVLGEVGKRERKKLCQLSVIILTSAARFSSVSGPGIWREV